MPTATVSGSAVVTYATGETLGGPNSGKFLESDPQIGALKYDREFISAAGDDGCGSKNYGFRSRDLTLQVCYIGASTQAVASGIETDLKEFQTGAPLKIVLDGISYYGCFLDAERSGRSGPVRPWNGLYKAPVVLAFSQRRLS